MFDCDDRIAVKRDEDALLPDSGSAILSRLISSGRSAALPVKEAPVTEAPTIKNHKKIAINSLSVLADYLDAPIVLVTMVENGNLLTYHSFGLAPGRTLGKLSTICHRKCQDGTYLQADITRDNDFAEINHAIDIDGNCFFIGVPVYDDCGDLIGTIAVLDKSNNVMVKGYSIDKLRSYAAEYIRNRAAMNTVMDMVA